MDTDVSLTQQPATPLKGTGRGGSGRSSSLQRSVRGLRSLQLSQTHSDLLLRCL